MVQSSKQRPATGPHSALRRRVRSRWCSRQSSAQQRAHTVRCGGGSISLPFRHHFSGSIGVIYDCLGCVALGSRPRVVLTGRKVASGMMRERVLALAWSLHRRSRLTSLVTTLSRAVCLAMCGALTGLTMPGKEPSLTCSTRSTRRVLLLTTSWSRRWLGRPRWFLLRSHLQVKYILAAGLTARPVWRQFEWPQAKSLPRRAADTCAGPRRRNGGHRPCRLLCQGVG